MTDLVPALVDRTAELVDALAELDDAALRGPSELPGWSRLTILCHLRYGAVALRQMTTDALLGRAASYYPEGRDQQRPLTLVPEEDERPREVVRSCGERSGDLHAAWSVLDAREWRFPVVEPEDNPDLGTVELGRLPILRLTEVEVHGTDLGIAMRDWSDLFVRTALPMRVEWLNHRRTNHAEFDTGVQGSWLLAATDGPSYQVTAWGDTVDAHPADPDATAQAVIEASSRDLLALLLGRRMRSAPAVSGDEEFARSFNRAFPGP